MAAAYRVVRSYHGNPHVALPALRRTTGRDSSLLGLPPFVDHLFDLPPLPGVPGSRCQLLRPRPQAEAADRARAARLLVRAPIEHSGGGTVGQRRTGPTVRRGELIDFPF